MPATVSCLRVQQNRLERRRRKRRPHRTRTGGRTGGGRKGVVRNRKHSTHLTCEREEEDRLGFRFLDKPTNEGANCIDRGREDGRERGSEERPWQSKSIRGRPTDRPTDRPTGRPTDLATGAACLLQTAAGLLRPPIERERGDRVRQRIRSENAMKVNG